MNPIYMEYFTRYSLGNISPNIPVDGIFPVKKKNIIFIFPPKSGFFSLGERGGRGGLWHNNGRGDVEFSIGVIDKWPLNS